MDRSRVQRQINVLRSKFVGPSLAKMDGLLENEVYEMAARTRWLHTCLDLPETGPDDNSWRVTALEIIDKVFGKK